MPTPGSARPTAGQPPPPSWAALTHITVFSLAKPFTLIAEPYRRRALAVYPVMLMYVSLAWLAMVKS